MLCGKSSVSLRFCSRSEVSFSARRVSVFSEELTRSTCSIKEQSKVTGLEVEDGDRSCARSREEGGGSTSGGPASRKPKNGETLWKRKRDACVKIR